VVWRTTSRHTAQREDTTVPVPRPIIAATRTVAADPASTALLLAGPSALDFWPDMCRIDETPDGRARAAGLLGGQRIPILVDARYPRRTPTSFVATFEVEAESDALPTLTGELTLTSAGRVGAMRTDARLELSACLPIEPAVRRELRQAGEVFLANLAVAAERHATAA
jgi:hypothetical protein